MDSDCNGNNCTELSEFEALVSHSVLKYAITQVQLLGSLSPTRELMEDTLENVSKELSEKHSYTLLKETVDALKSENEEQCRILEMNKIRLQDEYNQLKQKMVTIELDEEEQVKLMNIEVSAIKDELEDANFQQQVETKYIEKWEQSRINQGLMAAELEERMLEEKLEKLHSKIEDEERVHIEITNYLEAATMKLKEEIDAWTENYKKMIAHYDKELLITTEKRQIHLQTLQALNDKYLEHGRKIKEYIEEKKERERVQALQEHLNKMATRIQAWWRGVMVRRHLGPYKRKGKVKEKPKFKGKAAAKEKPIEKPKGK